jgi:hypothetical protein
MGFFGAKSWRRLRETAGTLLPNRKPFGHRVFDQEGLNQEGKAQGKIGGESPEFSRNK